MIKTTHDPSGIPSDLTGSYSYHNHPTSQTQGSFSAADVRFFFKSGATYSKSSDHLYEYVMRRSSDTLAVDPDLVYHRFDEVYWSDAMQLAFEEKIDAELDAYHETMLRLSEERIRNTQNMLKNSKSLCAGEKKNRTLFQCAMDWMGR